MVVNFPCCRCCFCFAVVAVFATTTVTKSPELSVMEVSRNFTMGIRGLSHDCSDVVMARGDQNNAIRWKSENILSEISVRVSLPE